MVYFCYLWLTCCLGLGTGGLSKLRLFLSKLIIFSKLRLFLSRLILFSKLRLFLSKCWLCLLRLIMYCLRVYCWLIGILTLRPSATSASSRPPLTTSTPRRTQQDFFNSSSASNHFLNVNFRHSYILINSSLSFLFSITIYSPSFF